MKKTIYILLISAIFTTSCDKVYINGDLDGMWRLSSVEYPDSTAYPHQVFYSYQRHMTQASKHYDEELPTRFLGELDYKGKLLTMKNFKSFPIETVPYSVEMLLPMHLYSDSTTFTIQSLDDETLVMQNNGITYTLHKW